MTMLAVLDTETTGDDQNNQVVELAIVRTEVLESAKGRHIVRPTRGGRWSSLIRPTCPVSPIGRACHHISDEELAQAPTMEELLARRGLEELEGETVLVAHNAAFDVGALLASPGFTRELLPSRTICTWRCALHLYPDAPAMSNQVLRYYLNLEVPQIRSLPPHRALPDAVVTQAIVERMLETHRVDKLVELTTSPALLKTIRFGMYRGQLWENVDPGYLGWILKQDFDEDAKHTARHWIAARNAGLRR